MEEQEQSVATPESENDSNDYIEAIKTMKLNTVERAEYDKVKSENKKLLDALVNGSDIDVPAQQSERPKIEDLRKELFSEDNQMSNLEYVTKALQLRNAVIAEGGADPFLPIGPHVEITEELSAKAERSAQVFQECIDLARGDSGVFTAELQRRMRDMPYFSKKK